MAPNNNDYEPSDESQALTENSPIFSNSNSSSPRRHRSSSSASTASLVLENLNGHTTGSDGPAPPSKYTDYDDDDDREDEDSEDEGRREGFGRRNSRRRDRHVAFEELDIEEDPLLDGPAVEKPANAKYRRWLWILGTICAVGWIAAFSMFVANGSYKHRSSRPHDPSATSSAGSGKRITIDQLQTGMWMPHTKSISWISDPAGQDGLLLEQGEQFGKGFLVVEDIRGLEEKAEATSSKTLMKSGIFVTPDGQHVPEAVWPSPDLNKVLIAVDKTHNWRHSFNATYYIFDVESQKGEALDPNDPTAKMQLALWSPDSKSVVFTRDNNVFIREITTGGQMPRITQVTTDGGPEMFNGVPDWVFEEEVFGDRIGTWISPDSRYIAFLQTNETGVADYPVQYFVQRPSGHMPPPEYENYPEERLIRYPKAGSVNPRVHIRFYDIETKSQYTVPIKDDFTDEERIITEVVWAGSTGQVLIKETNRESDILKMILVDVAERRGSIVRERDIFGLDGGWYEITESTTFVPADPANGRPEDGYIDTVIHEGYNHLGYFTPLSAPEPIMLTEGKWEVVDAPAAVDLKNNLVYFVGTKESSIQRHAYSVSLLTSGKGASGSSSIKAITDTSKDGYYDVSFSKLAGYVLLTYQGPSIPWQRVINTPANSKSFSHDFENNAALSRLASEHELPLKHYTTINIEGHDLNIMEYRPPHFDPNKRYPVLFHLYGGPGSQTVTKKFQVDFQSYVASTLGYLVVTLDNRGTGFLGRATRCAVRDRIGTLEAEDQITAAAMYRKKPYVDASRVAIWGWSYGGFLTLKTLETDAGANFRYGMAVAPVTDWRFYDTVYTERWMHTPQHNPDGYTTARISNVSALAATERFLVMHGTADDNVHVQNSLTLLDALDMQNVLNYDVHVFPDSDHSIYFHNANRIVYERLAWWLRAAFDGEWSRVRPEDLLSGRHRHRPSKGGSMLGGHGRF